MENSPHIPFPQSYWVLPGRLLAGPYPGALQIELAELRLSNLFDCGIRHVINLMEADEVNHQGQAFIPYIEPINKYAARTGAAVSMHRFPIQDGSIPSRGTMKQILDEIDSQIAARCPVYVHCWGGKGRTGTVIGCYLIRHNLVTQATVFGRIRQLRQDIWPYRESPETGQQREFVHSWLE